MKIQGANCPWKHRNISRIENLPMRRIIVITQREFADLVSQPLQAAETDLRIEFAWTKDELERSVAANPVGARLISLGSDIIVPAPVLNQLSGGAYKFHPGSPAYPGIFPSVFALYDNAADFGVTLHEMAPEIDSGPIVAVEPIQVSPEWDRLALDTATFAVLQKMLTLFAPRLADVETPLPRSDIKWSTPRRTRKDFEALCRLPEDADEAEFKRRYRAIGEGPDHAISITRFGRTFRLVSEHQSGVVRGGQPVK